MFDLLLSPGRRSGAISPEPALSPPAGNAGRALSPTELASIRHFKDKPGWRPIYSDRGLSAAHHQKRHYIRILVNAGEEKLDEARKIWPPNEAIED